MSKIAVLFLVVTIVLTGCSYKDQNFTYSRDIDNKGYFRGVKAKNNVIVADYANLVIPNDIHTVSDLEMDSVISELVADFSDSIILEEGTVSDGDTLNIDYVGKVDGVAFDGGSTENMGAEVTIGVTNYIEGFLDQLIGHDVKETFDIYVTFPDDYHSEELKGKPAVFTITINNIVQQTVPELTDEFVYANFYETDGWETVSQLKTEIESELKEQKVSDYIQSWLLENSVITSMPDVMVDYQEEALVLFYQTYANNYSMELEEFLQNYVGVESKEKLLEQYEQDNYTVASIHLILQAIAEAENIKADESDVSNYFIKYMNTDDYSQYVEIYGLNYLKLTALVQKVTDHLQNIAVFAD